MNAGRTQIARQTVSVPTRWLVDNLHGYLYGSDLLHHGAGKARHDTMELEQTTCTRVTEYDPNVDGIDDRAVLGGWQYDVVVSNYVLNVIPPFDRVFAILDIRESMKTGGSAYVTVRSHKDKSIKGTPHEDGVITSINTFQKGYTREELISELSMYFRDVEIVWENGSSIMAKCS
jgi:hypothetical protein